MQDLRERIALWLTEGLGVSTFHAICDNFSDIREFYSQDTAFYRGIGLKQSLIDALARPDWRAVDEHLAWSEQDSHTLLVYGQSPSYPSRLSEIALPPPILMVLGDPNCLSDEQVAIVGSRKASARGLELSARFAFELGRNGLVVTSGLALGIDGAAHAGALKSGNTVAVLGSGIDKIYPKRHVRLADEIQLKGAIVSEFSLKTQPFAGNFPRRNRIIAGLSLGVIVIEAQERSGSLITARLALEENREVMAVPGAACDPKARGTNSLIKQGAHLVEDVQDVLTLLGREYEATEGKSEVQEPLLDHIDYSPTHIDAIQARSGLSLGTLLSKLSELELKGLIRQLTGGYIKL